jgi:TonB family protein
MKKTTLIFILLGFTAITYSQQLIEQDCRKKSKGECLIAKKEIYKYDNGKYLVKEFNKNGTPSFIMDSAAKATGLDGHVQYFTKNGDLSMDGYYMNNVIAGVWKIYAENGSLVREISYDFEDKYCDTTKIEAINTDASEQTFEIVEELPLFEGGDMNKFRSYIQSNLFYPPHCSEHGISGRIFVKFVVDKCGNVVDAEIERGVDKSLDKEALRVVASSPQWTPGYQKGKTVKVRISFPVVFVLQ